MPKYYSSANLLRRKASPATAPPPATNAVRPQQPSTTCPTHIPFTNLPTHIPISLHNFSHFHRFQLSICYCCYHVKIVKILKKVQKPSYLQKAAYLRIITAKKQDAVNCESEFHCPNICNTKKTTATNISIVLSEHPLLSLSISSIFPNPSRNPKEKAKKRESGPCPHYCFFLFFTLLLPIEFSVSAPTLFSSLSSKRYGFSFGISYHLSDQRWWWWRMVLHKRQRI
ncbi:hypothetical protein Pfo_027995, partial [Paulownia fortunei]